MNDDLIARLRTDFRRMMQWNTVELASWPEHPASKFIVEIANEINVAANALEAAQAARDADAIAIRNLEIQAMTAQRENICGSCAGTGQPTSGNPCMCGGTGKASDAVPYLLERIEELEPNARRMHWLANNFMQLPYMALAPFAKGELTAEEAIYKAIDEEMERQNARTLSY